MFGGLWLGYSVGKVGWQRCPLTEIVLDVEYQVQLACLGVAQNVQNQQTKTGIKDAYTVASLLTHTCRWTHFGMGFEGLWD